MAIFPLMFPLPVAVMVAVVVPDPVTVVGLNEQVTPDKLEQEKATGPLKLLTGVTVIVAVPLWPVKILRLVVGVLALKSGGLANAVANALTSSEPRPLARSNPVEAL